MRNKTQLKIETNPTVWNRLARSGLKCPICPPNRGENAKRRPKHGGTKPKKKDKRGWKPLYGLGERVFHTSKEEWTRVEGVFWAQAGHPLDQKHEHWRYYVVHSGDQWSVPEGALESENAVLSRQRIQGVRRAKKRRRPANEPKKSGLGGSE